MRLVSLALILVLATAAHATPTKKIPLSPERKPMVGLIIAGSVAASSGWGAAFISSLAFWFFGSEFNCSNCTKAAEVLWIPLAGPTIAHIRAANNSATSIVLTTSMTVLQVGGAALMVAGYIGRRPRVTPTKGWRLTPLMGSVNGLGLEARW